MSKPDLSATVLVFNPGSTTTQVALFSRERELWREDLRHRPEELRREVIHQYDLRLGVVEQLLGLIPAGTLVAVVGRGGALKPLPGGTYLVSDTMKDDLSAARYGNHASNLGALLARGDWRIIEGQEAIQEYV